MKNMNQIYISNLSPIHFFLLFTISISGISVAAYDPTGYIAIACGSSGILVALDGQTWMGDKGTEYDPSLAQSNKNLQFRNASNGDIPYRTASISRFQFTYTFYVTAGQNFIRLYFNQAKYMGFDRFIPFFSVKAGPITLLTNFTGSSDSVSFEPREFCVNVGENQQIDITFTPYPSVDAYAFINGIEIVPMPAHLYYSRNEGPPFIGNNRLNFSIDNNTALEQVYRLNVGGSSLSPKQDPGIFRRWSDDTYYLPKLGIVPVNRTLQIKYTNTTPEYTAPEDVYLTARSMGMDRDENEAYNLTWVLPVDSGFNYLVRLHFCEFQGEIMMVGDRVFYIYINNQTAEKSADVILWSGGNGIPVVRDYVVTMGSQGMKNKRNLLIALHPQLRRVTAYSDAILNGIELFKINNSDGNLAVPNPEPVLTMPPIESSGWSAKKSKSKKTLSITVGGGAITGATVLSLLGFIVFRRCMKTKPQKTNIPSLPQQLCRKFTLAELKMATNNFDEALVIGTGGFGRVYKGRIDGHIPMAIKRLTPKSLQGAREFLTEIEMLSRLRHRHIVSLIGYCNDKQQMILVYDYMAHGTLRDHLYKTDNPPLPWKQRLEICIGAARGLEYLHAGANRTIIHRDVKTTNILVDENWVAKVSDFGLSKMGPTSVSGTHVSTDVKGTFGYFDPEYYWSGTITEKSDVFSFGVVLLEVLCGRAAVDMELEEEQHSLVHWARQCVKNGTIDKLIDPYLTGKIVPECLRVFVEIADNCLLDRRNERPKMGNVVSSLELALGLQESVETMKKGIKIGEAEREGIKDMSFVDRNQVGSRSLKILRVVHSCPEFWLQNISHQALDRCYSDKVGLNWARSPTCNSSKESGLAEFAAKYDSFPSDHDNGSESRSSAAHESLDGLLVP